MIYSNINNEKKLYIQGHVTDIEREFKLIVKALYKKYNEEHDTMWSLTKMRGIMLDAIEDEAPREEDLEEMLAYTE